MEKSVQSITELYGGIPSSLIKNDLLNEGWEIYDIGKCNKCNEKIRELYIYCP